MAKPPFKFTVSDGVVIAAAGLVLTFLFYLEQARSSAPHTAHRKRGGHSATGPNAGSAAPDPWAA